MEIVNGQKVRELRCRNCRAFITYEHIYAGVIVHRCPKCGELNTFTFRFMDVPSVRAIIESLFVMKKQKGGE